MAVKTRNAANRMNREQFFAKLAPLAEDQLQKALWNLYWRGNAAVRERIEAELEPAEAKQRKPARAEPPDPVLLLVQVEDFVSLARSGAYLAGNRRVSPRERTRWRFTFKRLIAEARDALRGDDLDQAAKPLELLIDLACELRAREYFRSEDPIEAAKVVVSDEVAALWSQVRNRLGFPAFAQRAAPQLIRWESDYGWTRSGWGTISEKETTLATVLEQLLPVPDTWVTFTDHYLAALDRITPVPAAKPRDPWNSTEYQVRERTQALAAWHRMLLDGLADSEAADRLPRLATHPALGGPELTFIQAQLAHRQGRLARARTLVHESLEQLPGHQGFLTFAHEIDASLPPRGEKIADERAAHSG